MDQRTNAEFWLDVMGESDDEGDVFEGFSALNRTNVNADSDLEIDFADVLADAGDMSSDSEEDLGSNVDMLPALPRRNWETQLHNVSTDNFKENVGVVHNLPVGAEPVDYFQLFFSESTFSDIATETNLYATQIQNEKGADPKWRPTTPTDIKLYMAINIMMGIHILPRQGNYWSTDDKLNVPCISRLMPRTRFEKISQYLHLNDRSGYQPRGQPGFDPLFKVRPVLESFREQCSTLYKPGREISIDEAMVKFNGRLYFKQYMKAKPTPWGIKVLVQCSSSNQLSPGFQCLHWQISAANERYVL